MNIVNIINFIRGVEPREPELDLVEPVIEQIKLVEKHGLPGTWLLQYDALIDSRFVDLMKRLDDKQDIGAWFEVVQPMVEAAGLTWRGRPGFAWDWHTDCGFSVGYTPGEREKLADVFMAEFRRVFGRYPKSVGSWLMDAHLLGYLADRYGVVASCNCKDQWGTDGYTMWGGYYNQAYYPSRKNAFVPAQSAAEQIPMPVFRMLGSDPIYQYDLKPLGGAQHVITLEPVYCEGGGGGHPAWVDWFYDTIFKTPSVSFGYTQIGQENSFGWPSMSDGLTYQIDKLSGLVAAGEVSVQTLADSGEWFRSRYEVTPASAVTALSDWRDEGRKSVWYCSRFYRVNLFWDESGFRVRDLHLFDEGYAERYLTQVCTEHVCTYDTLPVMDGLVWSDEGSTAGIRVLGHSCENPRVTEDGENLIVECDGGLRIICRPGTLRFELPESSDLEMRWAESRERPLRSVGETILAYVHEGFDYSVVATAGTFAAIGTAGVRIQPEGSVVELSLDTTSSAT